MFRSSLLLASAALLLAPAEAFMVRIRGGLLST
jgi:hypothetical protein